MTGRDTPTTQTLRWTARPWRPSQVAPDADRARLRQATVPLQCGPVGWLGGHTSLHPTIKQEGQTMTHLHRFHPESGYCNRCGLRNDGRLLNRAGNVVRNAPYYNAENDERLITQTIASMKADHR